MAANSLIQHVNLHDRGHHSLCDEEVVQVLASDHWFFLVECLQFGDVGFVQHRLLIRNVRNLRAGFVSINDGFKGTTQESVSCLLFLYLAQQIGLLLLDPLLGGHKSGQQLGEGQLSVGQEALGAGVESVADGFACEYFPMDAKVPVILVPGQDHLSQLVLHRQAPITIQIIVHHCR